VDSHVIPAVAAPLTIGSADGGNYFNGFIDDVRIYHRALEPSEIAASYAEVDTGARPSPISSIPAPPGLIAWWPGDGHCKDIVGNRNGVALNGADYAPGLIGQAFRVNGKNQYFSIASAAKLSFTNRQPFTLEAWVFRTGGTLPFHVIGKRDSDYGCWYQLAYDYRSPRVPLNAWTHLVLANDGSNSVDYLNGVAVSSNSTRCPGPNSADFQIGSSHNYGGFEGLIDDVRIYNRALAPNEVKAIYDAGSSGLRPPPVGNSPTTHQTNSLGVISLPVPQTKPIFHTGPDRKILENFASFCAAGLRIFLYRRCSTIWQPGVGDCHNGRATVRYPTFSNTDRDAEMDASHCQVNTAIKVNRTPNPSENYEN
jgi:hypothetical protein